MRTKSKHDRNAPWIFTFAVAEIAVGYWTFSEVFLPRKNWKLIKMSSSFIKWIWKKKKLFWKIQKSKKILSNTLWLFMILGFYISFLVAWIYWGQWPNGLRCCERIGRFLVQIPLSGWLVLGTQLCYEAPIVLWVRNRQKCIQLTSG